MHAEVLETYKVHKAIKEEVIAIEIIRNIIDKLPLITLEQNDKSKLSQLICSGLLKFDDWINNGYFCMKRCL